MVSRCLAVNDESDEDSMIRRAFLILTSVATVSCIAVLVISFVSPVETSLRVRQKWIRIQLADARLLVDRSGISYETQQATVDFLADLLRPTPRSFGGFSWTATRLDCPRWASIALVLLIALHPVRALVRGPIRRWNRRRHGLCSECAYNLRGNVSGRCPECGNSFGQS